MEWDFPVSKPSRESKGLEPFSTDSKLWESPFTGKDMSPKESRYAEFEDGPDAKKKYFVINADEEMNILCHAPDAKSPESALREALAEIESLKFKLAMAGDSQVYDFRKPSYEDYSRSRSFGANDESSVAWASEMHLLKEYELFEKKQEPADVDDGKDQE